MLEAEPDWLAISQLKPYLSQVNKQRGGVVLGVSGQGAKSHQEFRAKHKLPFGLLIGSDGRVLRVYRDVDPTTHAEQVLSDLKN